ncbi:unnamed protein product [Colias eurytheme]|nr:unnamed protein product [Colias eurytheme]
MSKCDNCNKGLTKRTPGLECSKCGKVVHATQSCTGLSSKQLSALRAGSLEWTCDDCQINSPHKKSSFIIPLEEEEDDTISEGNQGTSCIDTNKFLKDITLEMKRILKKELQPIETSLSFCCDKIDELTRTVEAQNKQIKELEKKYTNLKNEKSHLDLEINALKQHVRYMEQQRLDTIIEVANIPSRPNEDLNDLCNKLADNLNLTKEGISNVKRLEGRNGQDGCIQLEFKQEELCNLWVRASRRREVLVGQVVCDEAVPAAKTKVIVRKALTKANKTLLWQAKQKLTPNYKYVWFQNGNILIRKSENNKPIVIRSETDIENLLNQAAPAHHRR